MALLAAEARWDELLAALGVCKRLFADEAQLVATMVEIANIHVRLKHGDAAREALTSGLERFPANETLLGELGFPVGLSVRYLVNPPGTTVGVNPDGTAVNAAPVATSSPR